VLMFEAFLRKNGADGASSIHGGGTQQLIATAA